MPVRGDPAHFPYTRIVDRTSGHLAVRVGRNRYGYVSIEDMAEQFPGLTFQGSGSADVDYLFNFLSITNYTDDLLGESSQSGQETHFQIQA